MNKQNKIALFPNNSNVIKTAIIVKDGTPSSGIYKDAVIVMESIHRVNKNGIPYDYGVLKKTISSSLEQKYNAKEPKKNTSFDIDIMTHAQMYDLLKTQGNSTDKHGYQLKIVIEHLTPQINSFQTDYSIFIPNMELLTEWDVQFAKHVNIVLAKYRGAVNTMTQNLYLQNNKKSHAALKNQSRSETSVLYSSFTSVYQQEASKTEKDPNLAIHFAGTNFMKGTMQLIRAWCKCRGFTKTRPKMKLVITRRFKLGIKPEKELKQYWKSLKPRKVSSFYGRQIQGEMYGNIFMTEFLDDDDYKFFLAKAQYYICPSLMEGFGHYINEGRAHKALVLTTDCPPMNELIRAKEQLINVQIKKFNHEFLTWLPHLYKGNTITPQYACFISYDDLCKKFMKILSWSEEKLTKHINDDHMRFKTDTIHFHLTMAKAMQLCVRFIVDKQKQNDDKKVVLQESSQQIHEKESKTNEYTVGEAHSTHPYDDKYTLRIAANDTVIQNTLKKGWLFAKYPIMFINSYLRPGDVVLDIGANIGVMTITTSRMVGPGGKVHAFEPFNQTYDLLKWNAFKNKPNGWEHNNIIIHKKGVGHMNGITTMSDNVSIESKETMVPRKYSTKKHTYKYQVKNDKRSPVNRKKKITELTHLNYGAIQLGTGGQQIELITIDSMSLPKVSFIKVDVEGAEPLVFYGARETIRKFRPIIMFEYNMQKVSPEMKSAMNIPPHVEQFDVVKYCRELGYDRIVKMDLEDYVLLPKGANRTIVDPLVNIKQIEYLRDLDKGFDTQGYSKYIMLKPKFSSEPIQTGREPKKSQTYIQEEIKSISLKTEQSFPKEKQYEFTKEHYAQYKATCDYAFATLVMKGDAYIPGAIVLGHSLRMTETKADIIALITNDVSDKAAQRLSCVFDCVIRVEYLSYQSKPLAGEKQRDIYKNWSSDSYTKWTILALEQWKKICLLDSDLTIISNIDHLFDYPTPCAGWLNNWIEKAARQAKKTGRPSKFKNHVENIGLGESVSVQVAQNALKDGFVISAHCVVLETSWDEFCEYKETIIKMQPFGFPGCVSMMDEQSIVHYQSTIKGRDWTQLNHRYNLLVWHMKDITVVKKGKVMPPYIVHFAMSKPWTTKRFAWLDLDMWWQFAKSAAAKYSSANKRHEKKTRTDTCDVLAQLPRNELIAPNQIDCSYCFLVEKTFPASMRGNDGYRHDFVAECTGHITCPRILRGDYST